MKTANGTDEYMYVVGLRDDNLRLETKSRLTLDEAKEYVEMTKEGLPKLIYKLVPVVESKQD